MIVLSYLSVCVCTCAHISCVYSPMFASVCGKPEVNLVHHSTGVIIAYFETVSHWYLELAN